MTATRAIRAEFDIKAHAVYVRYAERQSCFQDDLHGDGSLILDYDQNDDLIGIEMLSEPVGMDTPLMRPQDWVIASRAWERAQALFGAIAGAMTGFFWLGEEGDGS